MHNKQQNFTGKKNLIYVKIEAGIKEQNEKKHPDPSQFLKSSLCMKRQDRCFRLRMGEKAMPLLLLMIYHTFPSRSVSLSLFLCFAKIWHKNRKSW